MRVHVISKLLNIPAYKVTEIISISDKEICLRLEPYERNYGVCGGCGKIHRQGYHSFQWVTVEDLPLFGRRVYLYVVKRKYRCNEGDRIHTEEINWLRKWARVTRRFGERVNHLTAITTNQEAGWYLGLDDEVVYRIDKEMLEEKAQELLDPPPAAKNMSVDEVSYQKHHRYLTNVIDTDRKLIIWNDKGRKSEVLDRYYDAIGKDNCLLIESVALDGARTYISSTQRYAKNALIVLDRFHATKKVNEALEHVRKDELTKARANKDEEIVALTNCKQRFMLTKQRRKLTDNQAVNLDKLCQLNEPIYKAVLLKESFLQVYDCEDKEEATKHLLDWIKEAYSSGLEPFKELALKMADKSNYILNWYDKRISSAISEGFNNKIKRLKRMAYGYKDIDYFKLKIHQHCGLLNPRLESVNCN